MKITEQAGGRISIEQDDTKFARVILILGIALFFLGLHQYLGDWRKSGNLEGGIGALVTCALIYLFMSEKTSFLIDPQTGFIRWSRRRMFRTREGMIPFANVRSVLVQTPIGDEGVPSRRIAFITHDGKEIPVTTAYMPDGDNEWPALAERIRKMLAMPEGDKAEDADVAALVREGRDMDAIRTLRKRTGISLAEAHEKIKRDKFKWKP